jgi:DNA-directed RNA polymerase specialized sigma24 family protein
MQQKRVKKNYVNNKDLFDALVQYKKQCKEAEDSGEEKPIVPNYIGQAIYQIATRLATKPNFYNYSFREDMVMDGIENCLQYMHNFDPEKTQNPFAYFTQIIWYAFLRRIAKEKKQMYIKYKSSHEMISMGETYEGGDEVAMHLNTNADYINNFIEEYETKMKGKKKKEEED